MFDRIPFMREHTGYVLFLEDDYFVAPDLLHVIPLTAAYHAQCPDCRLMVLGGYDKVVSFSRVNTVRNVNWVSSTHNMGMAFKRSFWNELKKSAGNFCDYDDYNWDWSIQVGWAVALRWYACPLYVFV